MAIRKFSDLVSGMEHSEETPVVLIHPKNIELGIVAYVHLAMFPLTLGTQFLASYKRKTDRTVTLQNVGKVSFCAINSFVQPDEPSGSVCFLFCASRIRHTHL
jgi:hypothetical protein